MGTDEANVDHSKSVVNLDYEAVRVARDVEHDAIASKDTRVTKLRLRSWGLFRRARRASECHVFSDCSESVYLGCCQNSRFGNKRRVFNADPLTGNQMLKIVIRHPMIYRSNFSSSLGARPNCNPTEFCAVPTTFIDSVRQFAGRKTEI